MYRPPPPRRVRLALIGVAAMFSTGSLFPKPSCAQPAPDLTIQEIGSELEALLPTWRRLGRESRVADSLRRALEGEEKQVPVDTFQVGPFTLMAEPRQREMVQELFDEIWSDLSPLLRGSEHIFEPWAFLAYRSWNQRRMYMRGDSVLEINVPSRFKGAFFRREAYSKVGQVLRHNLPPPLKEWIGAQSTALATENSGWVARELATAPSTVARECFDGDVAYCKLALGLAESEPDWNVWYTAAERRHIVSRIGPGRADPRRSALWSGCVEVQNLEACDLFLSTRKPESPLRTMARVSLLTFSLRLRGEGSFQRLLLTEEKDALEQLGELADLPPDSLIAAWRREVLGAQPTAWAGLVGAPVAVLFWFVFFGALAMRSTRCRLG